MASPPNSATQPKRKRRWLRRIIKGLGFLLLLLVCLVLGTSIYLRFIGGNRLGAAIAEADRLDPDWRWDDIQKGRPVIPDDKNSFVRVIKIADLLPEKWPNKRPRDSPWEDPKSIAEEILDLDPPVLLDQKQQVEIRGELEKVANAVGEARQLLKWRVGALAPFSVEDVFSEKLLEVRKTRQVVNLLRLDAARLSHEGKIDEALASCRATLIAGRSVGHEPSLICGLVAIAGERLAWTGMERCLGQGQASDPALLSCQEFLTDGTSQISELSAVRGERALQFEVIGWLVAGDTRRLALADDKILSDVLKNPIGGSVHWLQIGWFKENQGVNLEFMTEAVEAAKFPIEEKIPRFKELDQKHKKLRSDEWPLGRYFLGGAAIPAIVKVAQAFHRTETERRCAITALAVERYRLAHQSWPDSLSQLVPTFIPKVPTDPYDRQPLRFRRLEDGVVIYSVGPDGKDNGGVFDRNDAYLRDKDVGFRLWDVAIRRQTPKPPPKEEDSD